jgi:hypothetical protein
MKGKNMKLTEKELFQKLNPCQGKEEYSVESFFEDSIDNNLTVWQLLAIEFLINKQTNPVFIIGINDSIFGKLYQFQKIYQTYDEAFEDAKSGNARKYCSFPENYIMENFTIEEVIYEPNSRT